MIRTIRIKNVKGTTVNQELTGKDIFIGRNGSGKSTRLQSVALAELGYIPGKGKTNQETFKLSTGEEMSAGLQLDKFGFDRSITRTEKLNSDGKKEIKYSESLTVSPNKGEKNATQMKARVTNEIGNFPVVFDFQEFLTLSDAKRREFIYGLSPISDDYWTKETVSSHLENDLLTIGLKANNFDLYQATQELLTDCLNEWPEGYDLSSGLQAMIAWIETQQKIWNKKKTDATGAVRELVEMKNRLEETDRDIVAKKEELKELRSQQTEVHGQIQAGKEIKRQFEQKKLRMEQLKKEIQNIADDLAKESATDYESRIKELEVQIRHTDITMESEKLQQQINEIRSQREAKKNEYEEVRNKINRIGTELHTMETVMKGIQEKGAKVCVLHHQISCDKDFSKFIGHVEASKPKLELQKKELSELSTQLHTEIRNLEEKENDLEKQKRLLHQSFIQESKENDRLRSEIDKLRRAEQDEKQSKLNKESKRNALTEELNRLQGEKNPPAAPLEILEPQYEAITKQIAGLETVISEKEKAKTTLSNSQTAMISASKAQYYHTACKNISDALGAKGIQGELVKSIVGPIEDMINENLQLMGVECPVFFSTESETGKEVFQFGWVKDDKQTNFDVLSTGEQLMFLSAFLITLLERADPPLKVLAIDNIENLDEFNLPNVLNGLNALSHKVDNILIAGVIKPSDLASIEGWRVWNLSPEVSEVANA